MALAITEKQHWKNRIETKLNQRISQLRASDPVLLKTINDDAKREVYAERDVADDFRRHKAIEEAKTKLEAEEEALLEGLYVKVFDEEPNSSVSLFTIERQLKALAEDKAEQVFLEHELGQKIARLHDEKEKLTDSILLAVDTRHIIDIWDKVTYLVTDHTPQPEQDTLFAEQEAA